MSEMDSANPNMQVGVEMPRWQCHKIVYALKIARVYFDVDAAKITNRETDGSATLSPEGKGYAEGRGE